MNDSAVQTLDDGQMQASTDFLPLLRANGLDSFESVMAVASDQYARNFPGRTTVRLELKTPDGGHQAVYLKRYERSYLSTGKLIKRALHLPDADDEAGREWNNIRELQRLGFHVPTPVAMGQKKTGGIVTRSFVMTAELTGAIQGDRYCSKLSTAERRKFMAEAAHLARAFHATGFVHRDFYLGHFFVEEREDGRKLFLIDLQRVFKPKWFRERWLVKDIGSLGFIALLAGATQTDLMRFYQVYMNTKRFTAYHSRFARRVIKRILWLQTRIPKHDVWPPQF